MVFQRHETDYYTTFLGVKLLHKFWLQLYVSKQEKVWNVSAAEQVIEVPGEAPTSSNTVILFLVPDPVLDSIAN